MSATAETPKDTPPASRWRLWIDGCGGYLLLSGASWSVGGRSSEKAADICVQADWPRNAGRIERQGGDYFWVPRSNEKRPQEKRHWIRPEQSLPIPGTATVTIHQPSPLSESAILKLGASHRFDDHVDAVVLVHQTLLIGPQSDCHIRCPQLSDRAVLTQRGQRWLGKIGLASDFEELTPGTRITLQSLALTLEQA